MRDALLPTPFHARTAEHNLANAWVMRGAFTVPAHYGDPCQEVLAPRRSAAMIDVSAQQDLRIEGAGAASLLSAACGAAVRGMSIGHCEDVHWGADGGGLRGYGVLSRIAEQDFLLRSAEIDIGWFASAAPRFDANLRDATCERGLLLLTGPYAVAAMVAARLEVLPLEPKRHAHFDWRGLAITVFHCGRLGGYELSVAPEDATLAFDRLFRGRRLVSLRLAGEEALQLLQLEAGLPLPYLDFAPARELFARAPAPAPLGFEQPHDAGGSTAKRVLAGLELESDQPLPFAPVFAGGGKVGRTLRSLYSPSLKAAIALAQVAPKHASPGTVLTVRHAGTRDLREVSARVVPLPFL